MASIRRRELGQVIGGTGVPLITSSGGVVIDMEGFGRDLPYLDESTTLSFGVIPSVLEQRFGPWEKLPTNEMLIVMAVAQVNQEVDGLVDRCENVEVRIESNA